MSRRASFCRPIAGLRDKLSGLGSIGRLSILEQNFEVIEGRLSDKPLTFCWLSARQYLQLYERLLG